MRDVAFAIQLDNTQQSVNAKIARSEVASQNEAVCANELTSTVRKHTTVPQSVHREGKSCNQVKEYQSHVAMQLVFPSANRHHPPAQVVDTTDDDLYPAEKLTQHVELAPHPVNWEKKPQLNQGGSDRAKPDIVSKSTVRDTFGTPPSVTRMEP